MSQNASTDFPVASQSAGTNVANTGASGAHNEADAENGGAAATATALAQEYGHKISEAATQAKEFVSDKMSVVGDKFKELQNADLSEMTEHAKDYARKNPGQAILISAAAGLLIGLIIRGRR